ncbi:MAG: hypothetical protein SOY32_00480, partial [Candidatus Faecousia sp.]|nr:hypothetical protein [Candidatus Faecousia sp.]
IKKRHPKGWRFFMVQEMGLERPLKKQSGGLFLGRGRVPFSPGIPFVCKAQCLTIGVGTTSLAP